MKIAQDYVYEGEDYWTWSVWIDATPQELESSWGRGVQLVERNLRALLAADDVQRGEVTPSLKVRRAEVERRGLDQQAAFELLRSRARSTRRRLDDVARQVVLGERQGG